MPIITQTLPMPTGPITTMMGRISVANPARAVKLRFTDASMVGCTVTVREASTWLGRYTNIQLGDFTQWMPSTELRLDVSGCAGGGSTWAPTVGVLADLGGFGSTAHSEASSNPYPAAGQHFTLALGQPSYIGFDLAASPSAKKKQRRTNASALTSNVRNCRRCRQIHPFQISDSETRRDLRPLMNASRARTASMRHAWQARPAHRELRTT
jgi:hypothetical protein